MCLSGGGSMFAHDSFREAFKQLGVKYQVFVANDTIGPIFTAFENGGLVVISGTGSICVLVNSVNEFESLKSFDDIRSHSSGGWGNLLGDEGSGKSLDGNILKIYK